MLIHCPSPAPWIVSDRRALPLGSISLLNFPHTTPCAKIIAAERLSAFGRSNCLRLGA